MKHLHATTTYVNSFCPGLTRFRLKPLAQAVMYAMFLQASPVMAGPTGGNIVGGTGSISQSGLNTTINQNTSSLAIDWQSFNVNVDERVQFIQPSSSAIALNRILGSNASQIYGRIDASGQIVLVNPHGVFFGQNASVNVGGLLASGLAIDPVDFMNGNYVFNALENTSGLVVNSGVINASLGGSVTLLGQQVNNEGLIAANLGAVNLAAGKQAILSFDADGLMGVRITQEILQNELGVDAAVLNGGEINAAGGRVLLTGSVSRDVFSQAVNTGAMQQATSVVVNEDGTFTLGAGADVKNSGSINVSSDTAAGQIVMLGENVTSSGALHADTLQGNAGMIELHAKDTSLLTENSLVSARAETQGQGGDIKILGDKVGLFDQARVDVSGANGGGIVLMGGDFQGNNVYVPNAGITYVGVDSHIYADALTAGNGGKIIVWADDITRYYGSINARGGMNWGDGGFAEVSGKNYLDFNGAVNLFAPQGDTGTLLLDPLNISIVNNGSYAVLSNDAFADNSGLTALIDATLITDILTGSNGASIADVELQARADIWVQETIDISSVNGNTQSLTLRAGDDIEIDAPIRLRGGTLTLSQGDTGCNPNCVTSENSSPLVDDADGRILDIDTDLSTVGGNIVLGNSDALILDAHIKTGTNATNNISTGSSVGGNITFYNDVWNDGTATALNITAGTGTVRFNGVAGGNSGTLYLAGLTVNSASNVYLNDVNTNGAINISASNIYLNGNLKSDLTSVAANILLTGSVVLTNDLVIDSNASSTDGSISINGTINDDNDVGNVTRILTLDSGSNNLTVTNAVGLTNAIERFRILNSNLASVNAISTHSSGISITANTINLGGNLSTDAGTNAGILDINGAVVLTADVSVDTNAAGTDGSVDFSSTINDDSAATRRTLSINSGSATTTLNGAVGGSERIQGLSITSTNTISVNAITTDTGGFTADGATLTLGGAINTNGGVVDLDAVNNLVLVTSINSANGNVFIDITNGLFNNDGNDAYSIGAGTGNVAITASGAVSLGAVTTTGSGSLSVTSGGSITQASQSARDLDIGGTATFNANSNAITLNNARNTLSGAVSLNNTGNNNVTLESDRSQGLQIGTSNIGSGTLAITSAGSITQTGAMTQESGAGATTFTAGSGEINLSNPSNDFTGIVSLSNSGTNAAQITDLNSLSLGSVTLPGGSFTANASLVNLYNDITTTTGGNVTFNAPVVLQNTVAINAGTGKIDFTGTLDAMSERAQSLTLTAGDVDFDGAVGSTTRLNNISITATGNVVATNSNITANSLTVTQSDSFSSGNIDTRGADIVNASGGSVLITATGNGGTHVVSVGDINTSAGTRSTNGNGNAGGNVTISGADITVSSITATGGNALGNNNNGGSGGTISITANRNNNTQSITLDGNVNALGGLGTDNTGALNTTRGTTPVASIVLGNTNTPSGTVNLTYTGNYTTSINITGSTGVDILNAANRNNSWSINGADSGLLNTNVTFTDFEHITGGSLTDIFTFTYTTSTNYGSIDGLINGGSGIDTINLYNGVAVDTTVLLNAATGITGNNQLEVSSIEDIQAHSSNYNILIGPDAVINWFISNNETGSVGGSVLTTIATEGITIFSGFDELQGGNAADTFYIEANNNISITLRGGISATSAEYDTLVGPDRNNTWQLTSNQSDAGVLNTSIDFYDIENLTGRTYDDNFIFNQGSVLNGQVDGGGGGGLDAIDFSNLSVVDITIGSLSQGMINIEAIRGNNVNSTITGSNNDNTWIIDGVNRGTIQGSNLDFIGFNNLVGGSLTDTFILMNGGNITGLINGGASIDIIQMGATNHANYNVQLNGVRNDNANGRLDIANIEQVDFSNSITPNSLFGDTSANTWLISGINSGYVSSVNDLTSIPTGNVEGILQFNNFSYLEGNTAVDTFLINGGTLASGINGGSTASDVIRSTNSNGSWYLSADNAGNYNNIISFISIETINGNNDALYGPVITTNNWNMTSNGTGELNSNLMFTGITSIVGGNTIDNILIGENVLSGAFNGGSNLGDRITLNDGITTNADVNNWEITGANNGTVNTNIVFSGMEELYGNNGSDQFVLSTNLFTGTLNGLTGEDRLTGYTGDNTWTIDVLGGGSVNSVSFQNIENLNGNTGVDTFNVVGAGDISGIINGGSEPVNTMDVLDLSALTSADVTIGTTISNTGLNIVNIEHVIGNSSDSTVRGEAIVGINNQNTWVIFDGDNDGVINDGAVTNENGEVAFNNFTNVIGSDRDDSFMFTGAGTADMSIAGGANDPTDNNDTIDYSNQTGRVEVHVGQSFSNGVLYIEGITGNNTNSHIYGVDGATNTWTISGNNDGRVVSGSTNMAFVNFNYLYAGSQGDVFNILSGGSVGTLQTGNVIGEIQGGVGNDEFNIALAGNETNLDPDSFYGAHILAGDGDDSITITGPIATYDVDTYSVNNSDLSATHYFSDADSHYTVTYSGVENINDDVRVTTLNIVGSSSQDLIEIQHNSTVQQFSLTSGAISYSTVDYDNKTNIVINGGADQDTVTLTGGIDLGGGNFSLVSAELIDRANSSFDIVSNNLLLDGVVTFGAGTAPFLINVNTLDIANGNVAGTALYINEADSIELLGINSQGIFNLSAGQDITSTVDLVASSQLIMSSTTGDIALTATNNNLSGALSFTADAGSIVLNNQASSTVFDLLNAANDLTIVSAGEIIDGDFGVVTVGGLTTLTATSSMGDRDIIFNNTSNSFNRVNVIAADNVDIYGITGMTLEAVHASGNILITSADQLNQNGIIESTAGDISLVSGADIVMGASSGSRALQGSVSYQANNDIYVSQLEANDVVIDAANGQIIGQNGTAANIVANTLTITSSSGIGGLNTDVTRYDIQNQSGSVSLTNEGELSIDRLHNNGNITLINDSTIYISSGGINANRDVGNLLINATNGSILGAGAVDMSNPDITAANATLFAFQGSIGTYGRPLVIDVPGDLLFQARTSIRPFFTPDEPTNFVDDSLQQLNSFDTVTALSGQQLVVIEELGEIDPAIFTQISNYNLSDISIRLPADQLYEEDDDEADGFNKILQ